MRNKNKAFTLIELLVVVAIIAALVGILSVAQRRVRIIAKNLQQKAAFHAADISLELYSKDFGGYPDSDQMSDSGTVVTGAQRFAEAMLGRDQEGFHPKSKWHPAKETTAGLTLYDISTLDTRPQRKPEYLELKRSGFYSMDQLWGATPGIEPTPVITDVFARNKVPGVDEKVGMPVLYFKADPTARFRTKSDGTSDPVANGEFIEYSGWVYNFQDNFPILQLPWLREPDTVTNGLTKHYQDTDGTDEHAQIFYEQLTKTERDTDGDGKGDFFKPYNANTFILISAGYDGVYGTKDDLTSFDY